MRKPKQRQTKPRQSKQRKPNDLSRSLAALDLDRTLIAVIEMGASSWLVAGLVPGVERQPLKKLETDEHALLGLLERWRGEAVRSGYAITLFLRGRSRRFLACALAQGAGHRGACDPCRERGCLT